MFPWLTEIVSFVGNKPVIIDGGANVGQTVRAILSVRMQSTIHAFEPGAEAFAQLSQQGFGKQVLLNKLALNDHIGLARFYSSKGPSVIASLSPRREGVPCEQLTESEEVSCTTVDSYMRETQLDYVDVLKLDLQGGELSALHGAENSLRRKKIGVVVSEVWFVPVYQRAPYYWEIAEYLHAQDYLTWWIDCTSHPDFNEGRWGDAVFVHRDLLKSALKLEYAP